MTKLPAGHAPETISFVRKAGALLALLGLAGCAELASTAGMILDEADLTYCPTCDWVVQEWRHDTAWSAAISRDYETEVECEQELARLSAKDSKAGYRCIYEGELHDEPKPEPYDDGICSGCDWAVQVTEYQRWERVDSTTYPTEARCQQESWHEHKKDPGKNFRCVNLSGPPMKPR